MAKAPTADLILHRGLIATLNRSMPTASAIAVKDGKFLRVGGRRFRKAEAARYGEVHALADQRRDERARAWRRQRAEQHVFERVVAGDADEHQRRAAGGRREPGGRRWAFGRLRAATDCQRAGDGERNPAAAHAHRILVPALSLQVLAVDRPNWSEISFEVKLRFNLSLKRPPVREHRRAMSNAGPDRPVNRSRA